MRMPRSPLPTTAEAHSYALRAPEHSGGGPIQGRPGEAISGVGPRAGKPLFVCLNCRRTHQFQIMCAVGHYPLEMVPA